MKTRKNIEAFREFIMMNPLIEDRIDYWHDGNDCFDVIVVMLDGSAYLYDSYEHGSRYAKSLEDLFKSPKNEDQWQKKFSYNLYRIMRRRGFNQTELAECSGVSQAVINNYINGKSIPTTYKLIKIADALGCTVNDLVYF